MRKSRKDKAVQMYNRINRIKMKLGSDPKDEPGQIDPEAIREADRMITELCEDCPQITDGCLAEATALWDKMRDMDHSDERENLAQRIFMVAHEIKDMGALCGYNLIADFAESLRDYIVETSLSLDAQRVIVQAHIDAMQAVSKQGVQDEDSPLAEELKKLVKKAVEKYS